MKSPLRAIAAAGLLAAGSIVAVILGGNASADTQICEQFGSTVIGSRYVVQNNRWGNDTRNRDAITSDWYLTSLQAGVEPWQGGVGLAVNTFSQDVRTGGTTTPPTTSSPSPSTRRPASGTTASPPTW